MSIIIALNNVVDDAVLTSTTTWETTLPLVNLQNYLLPKVAQTTNDDVFTLTATLSSSKSVGAMALAGHNLGRLAKVRVKSYLASVLVDDSDELWVWPKNNGAVISADLIATMRGDFVYFLPSNLTIDRVDITVDSTSNANNAIKIGRLFIGKTFEPSLSVEYENATVGYKSLSELQTVPAGMKYAAKRLPVRTATITYSGLTETEMAETVFDGIRQADLTGEVLFSYSRPVYQIINDVKAVSQAFYARCFLGNFSELNPISHAYYNAFGATLAIEEVAV